MSNNLFEILEIERGITADEFEANDDPGKDHFSYLGSRVYDFLRFLVGQYIFQYSYILCPSLNYAL